MLRKTHVLERRKGRCQRLSNARSPVRRRRSALRRLRARAVQGVQAGHVCIRQVERVQVQIFGHALGPRGAGHDGLRGRPAGGGTRRDTSTCQRSRADMEPASHAHAPSGDQRTCPCCSAQRSATCPGVRRSRAAMASSVGCSSTGLRAPPPRISHCPPMLLYACGAPMEARERRECSCSMNKGRQRRQRRQEQRQAACAPRSERCFAVPGTGCHAGGRTPAAPSSG